MPTDKIPDMRDRILAEATRLFATRGFDGTSLQEIADAVGIRKSSLLYHFRSKRDLRVGVLRQMIGHWNEALPKLLVAATSGQGQFDALVNALIAFFTADPFRARVVVRETLDRPDEIRMMMAEHVGPWVNIVADYVRRGQERGLLTTDADPEAYVVEMIILVISNAAAQESVGSVAAINGNGAGSTRLLREALRIARASLFLQEQANDTTRRTSRRRGDDG